MFCLLHIITLPDIIMVGREEIRLTEESARDVLYRSEEVLNEAALHALLSGPALAICFRLLDVEKHFVGRVGPLSVSQNL